MWLHACAPGSAVTPQYRSHIHTEIQSLFYKAPESFLLCSHPRWTNAQHGNRPWAQQRSLKRRSLSAPWRRAGSPQTAARSRSGWYRPPSAFSAAGTNRGSEPGEVRAPRSGAHLISPPALPAASPPAPAGTWPLPSRSCPGVPGSSHFPPPSAAAPRVMSPAAAAAHPPRGSSSSSSSSPRPPCGARPARRCPRAPSAPRPLLRAARRETPPQPLPPLLSHSPEPARSSSSFSSLLRPRLPPAPAAQGRQRCPPRCWGGEAARLPAPPRSHGGSRTAEPWSRRRSWSCWDPTASSAPSSCSCCCWVPSPPFYSSAAGTAGCRRADTPSNPSSRAARGAEVRRRAAARRRRAEGPGLRQPRRRPSPCNAAGGREGARGRAAPGAPRNFAPNFSGCIKDKCRRAGGGEGGERRSECSPDLCFLTDAVMRTHHFRSEVIYLARNFKVRSCSLYLSTCPYCCPRPFFFCNEIA